MKHHILFCNNEDEIVSYCNEQIISQYSNVFILVDNNTRKYCLNRLQDTGLTNHKTICILSKEQNKSLSVCKEIIQQLEDTGGNRESAIVNLGGGIISDIGGFCASIYKRGIDYYNIPTSFIGQIDAGIGGKTGVNFMHFKNNIGTFYFPKNVLIFPGFLDTIEPDLINTGLSEVFKYALIDDRNFYHTLIKQLNEKTDIISRKEIIYRAVGIKMKFVEKDPFDKGERKILNFGHTIGHGIETYLLKHNHLVKHGEAVAVGLMAELYLSKKKFNLLENTYNEAISFLRQIFTLPKYKYDIDEIINIIQHDKKNVNKKNKIVLIKDIASPVFDVEITNSEIREALKETLKLL